MENSRGGDVFFALCLAIRFVEGAGIAAYLTSVLVIVVKTFPTNPGYYVGLTESVITVAMIAGPPIGSFLYSLGGFAAPFVIFGVIIVLNSIACFYLVPDERSWAKCQSECEPLTFAEYHRVLCLPAGMLTIVCVTTNVTANAFVLISLSDHLTQFSLTTMEVGLVYLCLFLTYGFSSPASGHLADKTGLEFFLQSLGSIIVSIAFSLIGPAIFFHMKAKLWMIVTGLLLRGLGAGPLISCAFSASLRAARKNGMPDDFRTYSLVSTLISFSIPFGNLIGSISVGFMYENLGMAVSTTIYFGIFLLLAVVCFGGHLTEYPFKLQKNATERSCLCEGDIKMDSLSHNIFNLMEKKKIGKFDQKKNFGLIYNLEMED